MGTLATYLLPSWGPMKWRDEIKSGCITRAIFAVKVWAHWLQNPYCLGSLEVLTN